ncbi:hypothetical protein HL658_20660 [Azospirillum sp. RWY-5-1]|uniref:Uncharacterized protein n=1 Tax=Azospirillum oleiclasticum TaxID=2735135 RepID=A0ABX2TEF6_9PROT|nr:hypothetical protein [Azospirillum oleiclasticum]NYZ14965.1 hypothetical protein [Azospirillum oleiclasticum]NYZ22727.1 hypothetical protein [Azospirillum oleiclasticum]
MLALSLIALFIPVERYRPSCWIHLDRLGFEGRMREDCIAWLTDRLRDEGFSRGGFNAERKGDLLRISGTVRNRFGNSEREEEPYDFNDGQPGHYEAATLEPRGRGAALPDAL